MTEPTLFDPLPEEHTDTQRAWAARVLDQWRGMQLDLGCVLTARGAEGITPWEAVHRLGLPEKRIVTVRAALTTLHQSGEIVRCHRKRNGEYIYVAPWAWTPGMGREPSKPHRGRGSRS